MEGQQAGQENLGAEKLPNPMLNSRANTASTASRPQTVNPTWVKPASRSHRTDGKEPHVEYIPALKLE